MKHSIISSILLVLSMGCSTLSHAGKITFDLAGTFDRVLIFNPNALPDITLADSYIGQFSYDPLAPLFSIVTENTRARYNTGEMIINTGVNRYAADQEPQLQIFNDWVFPIGGQVIDEFFLGVYEADPTGTGFFLLQFNLREYDLATFNDLSIPTIDEILALEQRGHFFLRRFASHANEEWAASGPATRLSLATVNVTEPSVLYLMLLAIAFIARNKRPAICLDG